MPKPQIAARPLSVKTPAAPPVYRPQSVPAVLQRKQPVTQPVQPIKQPSRPVAPPVYKPQPKPHAQMKVLNVRRDAQPINQNKAPMPAPVVSKRPYKAPINNGIQAKINEPKRGLPANPNISVNNPGQFRAANSKPAAPRTIQRRRANPNQSDVVQRNLFKRLAAMTVAAGVGAYAGFTSGAAIGSSIGAAAGATAGSAVPVAGTAAGGVAGGVTGGTIGGLLLGTAGLLSGAYTGFWATEPGTPTTPTAPTTGTTVASSSVGSAASTVTTVSSSSSAAASGSAVVGSGAAAKKKKKKKKAGAGAAAAVARPTYTASKAKFDEVKKYFDKLGRLTDWRFAPNADLSGTVSLSATQIPNAGSGRQFRVNGNCIYRNSEGYLPAGGTYNEFWIYGGTAGSQRLIVADGDSPAQRLPEKWFTSGGTHGGVQYWRKWNGAAWKDWNTGNQTANDFVIAVPTLLTQAEADVLIAKRVVVPATYIQ